MRMAVTGGTGFVGSHLLEAAVAVGHEVVGADPPRAAARDSE